MIGVARALLAGGGALAVAVAGLASFTGISIRRAERLVPPDGRFLDVPGARLHYTDEGSGPTIVLIHGLGGQLRNFARPLIERLARSNRVIAIDRPGSGYSTLTGPYPDLARQAMMVSDLIVGLKAGPVILAGHSLGGALSLALVEARPDLVSALALIAPLTEAQDEAPSAFKILTIRSATVRALIGWTLVAPFARLAGKTRREPVFAPDPVPDDFEVRGGGALVYRPRGFDAASRDIQGVPAAMPAIRGRYPAIARPVSVLFGRGDRILDPQRNGADFVAQVPGATLTLVDGGHMLPFTRPLETADWIASITSQNARPSEAAAPMRHT